MEKNERIDCSQLKDLISAGVGITILDVRNTIDFAKSEFKIKGAVRIPINELEVRSGELDPLKEVIAYCT